MKDKTTSALLAFILGGFGVHKFYLGKTGMGLLYLVFSLTYIPAIVAFIESLVLFSMTEKDFNKKYNSKK